MIEAPRRKRLRTLVGTFHALTEFAPSTTSMDAVLVRIQEIIRELFRCFLECGCAEVADVLLFVDACLLHTRRTGCMSDVLVYSLVHLSDYLGHALDSSTPGECFLEGETIKKEFSFSVNGDTVKSRWKHSEGRPSGKGVDPSSGIYCSRRNIYLHDERF
ncbi:hypothetical protein [Spirochaeta thermophila]|uniref:Uncharacterized protein n=1 Tax=Winmispira thermophila (strain ATCC 49972 / DSM 6192 / RI 19.B1) TaxID=665571 RepID=E0RSK4_WINT6|nr:hypothetical protein [Spirochaeta thermophila]ADN01991.1 hypothetical protein STHERM_c10460 [Spirochaeta thermophila DSM 6192]